MRHDRPISYLRDMTTTDLKGPLMAVQQVPGPDFWTITPFTFETPEGWSARQTADQLAYMEVDGEPSSNCGIQWKRISSQIDLRLVAQMSQAVTRKIDPEVKVGVSRYGRLHGRLSYLRISEFTPPDRPLTGQVYTAFFGPSFGMDRPIELFEIIGHFDATNGDRMRQISDIIASFHFIVADGTGA